MPQATINDVDEGPAGRFEHVFGLEFHGAVSAQNLEIGAPRNDAAAEPRARNRTSEDRNHTPQADPGFADRDRLPDLDANLGDEFESGGRDGRHAARRHRPAPIRVRRAPPRLHRHAGRGAPVNATAGAAGAGSIAAR